MSKTHQGYPLPSSYRSKVKGQDNTKIKNVRNKQSHGGACQNLVCRQKCKILPIRRKTLSNKSMKIWYAYVKEQRRSRQTLFHGENIILILRSKIKS